MTPRLAWLLLASFYGAFTAWYTSCAGPLTPAEIDRYVEVLVSGGAEPERIALWRHFMETDTGDDFAMLNSIDLRAAPLPVEGVPSGETAEQVLARYTTPFLGRGLRSAAHPVVVGWAAGPSLDLWGIEGAEQWTQGGLVRYRSRRDLMEQVVATLPTGIHAYKIAAIEKTVAFPLDPWFQLGDPRLVLALAAVVLGLAWQLRCAPGRARSPRPA